MSSKLPHVGTTIFSVMSAMAAEEGAVNLAQGFPDFDPAQLLRDRVCHHVNAGMNQYAPVSGVPILLRRIGELVKMAYGYDCDPLSEITITSGAAEALYTAITTFVHPGDEVIIIEPAYDLYVPAIELCGATPVALPTFAPDYKIDHEALAALVTSKTRMLILNTPHNPTGVLYNAEDITRIAALAEAHNFIVLSDEVYEHLVFDGQRHESVLRYPSLRERCMAVFSFGKTYHATGWRIGYIVGAAPLMREFRKVHQYNTFSINSFLQYALADYMEDPATWQSLGAFYQQKRDYFADILRQTKFTPITSQGTFFQLADYSQISDEPDHIFTERLCRQYKVAAIPLSPFYKHGSNDKIIRFCFAKREETLRLAGDRLLNI